MQPSWFLYLALAIALPVCPGCSKCVAAQPLKPNTEPVLPAGALARLGTLALRHASKVNAVAFSPDGKLLASASGQDGGRDNTVRLWDVGTGAERVCFTGHASSVYCVAFSPDGKVIASGGKDWIVRLCDAATGREVRRLTGSKGAIEAVAFSPDGKSLATGSHNDRTVRLWDVATGQPLREFTAGNPVNPATRGITAVAFTPDGKTLAAGGPSELARLWDVASGAELRSYGGPHTPRAEALAISSDGKVLATAGGLLYDRATGKQNADLDRLWRSEDSVQRIAISPDGSTLALAGFHGHVRLWDVKTDRELRRFSVSRGNSGGVAFSPDGKLLAWGGYGNVVRLWEWATGKELHGDGVPRGPVSFVGFGPGGAVALVGDETIRAWDLGTAAEPLASRGRRGDVLRLVSGTPLALSPNGKLLVTGGWNRSVQLFELGAGEETNLIPMPPNSGAIRATFTADSKQLLVVHTDMRTMGLWDLATGKEVRRFVGHNSPVDAIAFSPDGKLLVSSGAPRAMIRRPPPGFQEDTGCRVWDVTTGKELQQFPGRDEALAFSPDGTLLAAGSGDWKSAIRLLDPTTGAEVRRLQFSSYGPDRLVFSPDGKALASVGRDQTVRLWEIATGGERRQFTGHTGELYCVAFSPDGRRLLSGGADTTAVLWDVYAPERPGPADLKSAVQALDGSDASAAYRAICALLAAPQAAVPLLAAAVRPAEPVNPQRMAQLVGDLGSERFAAREQATTELTKLGDTAEPALRELLARPPNPEARRRAEQLLTRLHANPSPMLLRGLRAIEVLEAIATPAARHELDRLAGGAPAARLTREARIALDRLDRRTSVRR